MSCPAIIVNPPQCCSGGIHPVRITLYVEGKCRGETLTVAADPWISPVVVLALVALAATMTRLAGALAIKFIALEVVGAQRITSTSLAAFSAGDLPVVWGTAIARTPRHVGQAWALSCHRIAVALVGIHAQDVADALVALLARGIPIVARATAFAVRALRVVQATQAKSRAGIAVAGLRLVHIAAALTASA